MMLLLMLEATLHVHQESRWATSLKGSGDLTKTEGPNNTLKLNDLLLHTVI